MAEISLLVKQLASDYPLITFEAGDDFVWSPDRNTVSYNEAHHAAPELLLHELGHALLQHHDYRRDVQLLGLEVDAWTKARAIASNYDVTIGDDTVEDHLDTYRDWLHARSTCPACEATGHQIKKAEYSCIACGHQWRVNDARVCALRRYSTS